MSKAIHALGVSALLLPALLLSCAAGPPRAEPALPSGNFAPAHSPSETTEALGRGRMIAVSVSMDLLVRNTEEEARASLIQQAGSLGGFVLRATETSIVARVPAESVDGFLEYARSLGTAQNERRTGTDITDQFMNDVIRLDNLRNVRVRYLALLDRANTISEMISIERELERVVLEIERLEARARQAESSVAYSTVSIRVRERSRPGPVGWVFYGLFLGIRWLFVW